MAGPEHLREIDLPAHVLARWKETAAYLANVNAALLPEVQALEWDCTAHSLTRCAMAARYIAAAEAEPYAGAAKALAAEFEEATKL
ncbi:MAG: hypothetical protein EKK41_21120 [Hyphomicrobiales bacterium]|nr:MAG: hypothetical protein EKK41_21120 [Hyphomicrobiales bacterium]